MTVNQVGAWSSEFRLQRADLPAAEEYLRRKGVDFTHGDGTTLLTDPATTHGVVMGFTTWSIPGDTRPDWLDEA